MKVELTKKEYKQLLQVLEIADWVLNAHAVGEDEENKEFQDIEQKIFALAKEFGYGSLIRYDPELKGFFPTRKYEETCSAMSFIEDFEDETVWEGLAERLAERDAVQEIGEKAYAEMDAFDRLTKIEERREKYIDEFENFGVERLVIAKQCDAPDVH